MIKFYVYDKQFGKPYINYRIVNTETSELLEEGKCKEYEKIGEINFGLIRKYGNENVKMLSR